MIIFFIDSFYNLTSFSNDLFFNPFVFFCCELNIAAGVEEICKLASKGNALRGGLSGEPSPYLGKFRRKPQETRNVWANVIFQDWTPDLPFTSFKSKSSTPLLRTNFISNNTYAFVNIYRGSFYYSTYKYCQIVCSKFWIK